MYNFSKNKISKPVLIKILNEETTKSVSILNHLHNPHRNNYYIHNVALKEKGVFYGIMYLLHLDDKCMLTNIISILVFFCLALKP